MALPLEASSVYGAFTAVASSLVEVIGHMLPVEVTSSSFIYVTLAQVSCQFWIMCQVEKAWLEQFWYQGLYGAVE